MQTNHDISPEFIQEKYIELIENANLHLEKKNKTFSTRNLAIYTSVMSFIALAFFTINYFPHNTKDIFDQHLNAVAYNNTDILIETEAGVFYQLNNKIDKKWMTSNQLFIKANNNKIVFNTEEATNKSTYYTLWVPKNKKYKVMLTDGTEIDINSNSKLRFTNNRTTNKKNATLNGEAFFKVAHNPTNIFSIQASEMNIEVYGTEFNISNFKSNNYTSVALLKGSVSASTYKNKKEFIKPGQQAIYHKKNDHFNIQNVDFDVTLAWRQNELHFIDESLSKIIKKIEKWYPFRFDIQDKQLGNICFTGNLNKEDGITHFLQMLHYTEGIQYDINNQSIILYK